MVFLKVCLIYKGWKVYCHLESTARQPWSVGRQLCTAARALCLLHVFKLPCLNLAFCRGRNTGRPGLQERGCSPPHRAPPPGCSGLTGPAPPYPLQAHLPAAAFLAYLTPRWPLCPIPQSSAGPPEVVTDTHMCKGF